MYCRPLHNVESLGIMVIGYMILWLSGYIVHALCRDSGNVTTWTYILSILMLCMILYIVIYYIRVKHILTFLNFGLSSISITARNTGCCFSVISITQHYTLCCKFLFHRCTVF